MVAKTLQDSIAINYVWFIVFAVSACIVEPLQQQKRSLQPPSHSHNQSCFMPPVWCRINTLKLCSSHFIIVIHNEGNFYQLTEKKTSFCPNLIKKSGMAFWPNLCYSLIQWSTWVHHLQFIASVANRPEQMQKINRSSLACPELLAEACKVTWWSTHWYLCTTWLQSVQSTLLCDLCAADQVWYQPYVLFFTLWTRAIAVCPQCCRCH